MLALAIVGAVGFAVVQVTGDRLDQVAGLWIQFLDKPAASNGASVVFSVRQGDTADEIGRRLERAGLIGSANNFRILVGYYGAGDSLKAGEYELNPTMSTSDVITKLRGGLVSRKQVTFPEGWRATEMTRALVERGIFTQPAVQSALESPVVFGELAGRRPAGASLEGYLFPDTYTIAPSDTAVSVVQQMVSNLDRQFTPALRRQAADTNLTFHEILTLASIVERESAQPSERPMVASVYLNRMKINMKLDADPTVQYALAMTQTIATKDTWKPALSLTDLRVESPYNTYQRTGLPPGPICNPGIAAIKAVLEPAKTDFLYFVARGDGTHVFAKTLDEHLANVRRYGS